MSAPTAHLSEPYRGPEEFRYVDRAIFKERDEEIWEILQLITMYRGVVIYGESGHGKSSLVNAGLVPELVQRGYSVDRVRVQPTARGEFLVERISELEQGVPPFLESGLIPGTIGASESTLTDAELAEALSGTPPGKRRLLVFDQFEEIVTRFEESSKTASDDKDTQAVRSRIIARIESILDSDSLAVKLLFVFREDYMAPIRSLLSRRPEVFRQYYWLRAPSTGKTQAIVEGPLQLSQFNDRLQKFPVQELVAQLNSNARKGSVNLTDLQIACLELWRSKDPTQVLDNRKVNGLIEDYLSRALDSLKKSGLREPAIALLGTMITPDGTRNVISEYNAIERVAPLFPVLRNRLPVALEQLVKTRLVRKSLEAEGTYYEIVSEFLSTWINVNRLRQEAERQRVRTQLELRKQSRIGYLFLAGTVSALLLFGLYVYTRVWANSDWQGQHQLLISAQDAISKLQLQKAESDRLLRVLSTSRTASKKGGTSMFGSDTLEVVVGVVFLVSLLSLICSALNEAIAWVLNSRAQLLRRALWNLFRDEGLVEKLFHHPLVRSVSPDHGPPSYIPPSTFAMALLDIVAPAKVSRVENDEAVLKELSFGAFRVPDGEVRHSLMLLVSQSRNLGDLYRNIEDWFNNATLAVASAYKRRAQTQLFALALLLAVVVNVDTLAVIKALSSSSSTRAAVGALASDYAQRVSDSSGNSASNLETQLATLEQQSQLPITWSGKTLPQTPRDWYQRALGWLITAIMVALCAPFWFAFMNWLMSFRIRVKPYEGVARDEVEWDMTYGKT